MKDIIQMTDKELIETYSAIIKSLKERRIIRTKNLLGDLAEYLAIDFYSNTPGLPKLQAAPIGTENIDAISRHGDRYSIKATSGTTTGVFYGLEPPNSAIIDRQKFEYLIICRFDDDYSLKAIYEMTWDEFLKHKRWHSRMQAWNITLTKSVVSCCNIIYEK